MQYGEELFPYQRVAMTKGEKKKSKYLRLISPKILFFIIPFLVSRVILINGMAPFGLAFFIGSITNIKNKEANLEICLGTLLGYISLYNNIKNLPVYCVLVVTIGLLNLIINNRLSNKKRLFIFFTLIFVEFAIYNFFINKFILSITFLNALFELACVLPLYFILDYAIICFKNIRTKHLFTSEEIISMAITLSLVISGCWGIVFKGVSLRNVIALIFILMISYINGSTIGATSGVALGAIVGMSSGNMMGYISMYGLCGLISGIFKEMGKWISAVAYLVSFSILILYSDSLGQFKIIEAMISTLVFLSIPNKIYKKLILEFNYEKKYEYINNDYAGKVKGIIIDRLNKFSDVLYKMSDTLTNLVDNDKLVIKNKSSALIENLADRVCANCNMRSMCWKREMHYTYSAFEELIENFQSNDSKLPKELERKCVNRLELIRNTDKIVNNYVVDQMWRKRLSEGRELLSDQIKNMAGSIEEIIEEVDSDININIEIERRIVRAFNKNQIKFNDILCFTNKKNRLVINIGLKACLGKQICTKEILPIINIATGKSMMMKEEYCNINPNTNSCTITFEETPKYYIESYANKICKDGERYSGDNYIYEDLKDGTYMMLISDGMGSGPQANQESSAAVQLIKRFTEAGFSKEAAINTVNSIMTLKFCEDEKFSTLDLSSIDLYSGDISFIKVGAVASFIKRDKDIKIINSKSLPIGVLDKVDVDINNKKLKNGDIVIMVSDGVLDYDNDNLGKTDWVVDYLKETQENDPQKILDELMKRARKLSGSKVRDDMTAIVSKVYSLY